MKAILFLVAFPLASSVAPAVELRATPHTVIHDIRTYSREESDRRHSVWTDEPAKVAPLAKELGIDLGAFKLEKGKIFAVFFHDHIKEDLVQITVNNTARSLFADYADSGIEFRLRAPEPGKKHSHLTAVVFNYSGPISHLGVRGMIFGGLSIRK